jgi:hypothetical protein
MGVNHTIYGGGHSRLVWRGIRLQNMESVLYFCNAHCTEKNAFNPLILGTQNLKNQGMNGMLWTPPLEDKYGWHLWNPFL